MRLIKGKSMKNRLLVHKNEIYTAEKTGWNNI